MITIVGLRRCEGKKGPLIALDLLGDVEMIQSQDTGRFYATARRCSVASSFDERTAQMMVGRSMPGTIERTGCAAYDYTIPESGEVIKLAHTYQYVPERTAVALPRQQLLPSWFSSGLGTKKEKPNAVGQMQSALIISNQAHQILL